MVSVASATSSSPAPGLYLWNEFSGSNSLPGTHCSCVSHFSFRSLCLSLTGSPPTLTLYLPLYTLVSFSPFLLPSSPFSSLLLPLASLFPPLSPLTGSLSSLSLLSFSLSLSFPPFPPPPTPTGALCVQKLCGWQPESTPPHPPTHAQLGRSSHGSETLPSHHPSIHSHSPAISFCYLPAHHWTQCSSRVG